MVLELPAQRYGGESYQYGTRITCTEVRGKVTNMVLELPAQRYGGKLPIWY